jgi:hypothetical protein
MPICLGVCFVLFFVFGFCFVFLFNPDEYLKISQQAQSLFINIIITLWVDHCTVLITGKIIVRQ